MQEALRLGFAVASAPEDLVLGPLGVVLWMVVGVLSGAGALAAISLLLPLTFHLEPVSAVIMLAGIYYGSEYAGSTAAILLNLPGGASSAVTCLDGYAMARQGAGRGLPRDDAIASFIGASVGILLMILAAPTMVRLGLSFGPALRRPP